MIIPAMVPRKMASKCHAWAVTPAGAGRNQTVAATPMQMASFFKSAPHLMPAEMKKRNKFELIGGRMGEILKKVGSLDQLQGILYPIGN